MQRCSGRFFRNCACCPPPAASATSRRNFIAGGAVALGLAVAPARVCADHVKGVQDFFDGEAERRMIERDNALALMPRLSAA